MTAAFDAVVLGAGIVGAACALELAGAGMTVAIVERDVVGGGATAAGMGHIVVMDDSPAQFALTRYSQDLWNQLAEQLPDSVEYDPCGTLWIAASEEEFQEAHRKFLYYQAAGLPVEMLDGQALSQAEPNLRAGLPGALLVKRDSVVYAPCAAAWLLARARQMGATLYLGHPVAQCGQGSVQLRDGTRLTSPHIVIALGADASALTPGLPIRKRKGHLVITDRYPGFARHQLVELGYLHSAHSARGDSVAFNVQPRRTGQVLIGSSRQFDSADPAVDRAILDAMLQRAELYMPGLRRLTALRVWTGFRAATPDKLPLIGPWLEDSTLYLATGHEGLGITTSLATARLLADCILRRASAIPLDPYLPARIDREPAHA